MVSLHIVLNNFLEIVLKIRFFKFLKSCINCEYFYDASGLIFSLLSLWFLVILSLAEFVFQAKETHLKCITNSLNCRQWNVDILRLQILVFS